LRGIYNTLLNKIYVDEIYAALIVKPLLWLSTTSSGKPSTPAPSMAPLRLAEGMTGIGDGVRHTQSGTLAAMPLGSNRRASHHRHYFLAAHPARNGRGGALMLHAALAHHRHLFSRPRPASLCFSSARRYI